MFALEGQGLKDEVVGENLGQVDKRVAPAVAPEHIRQRCLANLALELTPVDARVVHRLLPVLLCL